MKTFLDNIGINKQDEDFIKNVSKHHYEVYYDNVIYMIYKMGLTDKLNEEIRRSPNSFNADEKKNFITKKALELLGSKIPQEVRKSINADLVGREARIDKYVNNKEDFITYFCLQALLYNRFNYGNVFNRVFDTNIKSMYNSNKELVSSWIMCSLRDRWKKETMENSYKKKVDGITFSSVSQDKLDELLNYYDRVTINKDVVGSIFLKRINSVSNDLYVTNTPLDNGPSSVKDGIVYFNDRAIKTNNSSVFFHELSHYFDDTNDNPSIKAYHNLIEIIRNDHRLESFKSSVETAARENHRFADTSEVASMYDALYKGELNTYYGFPGHGVSYFSKPGNAEKEIFANVGELVTAGREGLLFEFFPKEYASSLIRTYYIVIFGTDKEFSKLDNSLLANKDKEFIDNINNLINDLDGINNSTHLNESDYNALYLLQPMIIEKYFNSMMILDDNFGSSLKDYLDNDCEIEESSLKNYLDLMGKERAKIAIRNYLCDKEIKYIKK